MLGIYRFILALNVAIFHLLGVNAIGPYAVFSFFILSGFLMTLIMHESYGYSVSGIKKYALNRVLRLFPVYWALLITTLLIILWVGEEKSANFHAAMAIPDTTREWLSNIFLMFIAERPIEVTPRLAPATWALTIELFFYFLIGLGISRTKTVTIIWLLVSLLYTIYFNVTHHLGIGYGTVMSASLPFALGACAYHFKDAIFRFVENYRLAFPLFVCFLLNLIVAASSKLILPEDIAWKAGVICVFSNLALSVFMTVVLFKNDKIFRNSTTKMLGDLSYPLYIFHWSGALLAAYLLNDISRENSPFTVFLIGLVMTLILSAIIERTLASKVELIRRRIKF